uniref:RecF/RecN/SMC N-terminal domain-containing protein n=1 Tax=Haptolina ericina TaxID=156174 RepID=A0A7S3AWC9_9EUKA
MTGGSSYGERARANKWDQKEYTGLKERYESLSREIASLASSHASEEKEQALRHQLSGKQQELSAARADLDLTKTKEAKHRKELAQICTNLDEAERQLAALEQKKSADDKEVKAMQAKCDSMEDKIFAAFSKSLGVASVREYEDRMLRETKEQEEHLQALKAHEAKLRSQLQFEKTKDLPAAIQKLQKSIDDDVKSLEKLSAAKAKSERASEEMKAEAAKMEAELETTKATQESKSNDLKALKKTLKQASDEIAKARSKVAQIQAELEQHRSTRQRTFQRARLEEIALPMLDAEAETSAAPKAKRKRGSGPPTPAALSDELQMSESFSASGLVGSNTLDGGEASAEAASSQVVEGEDLVRIDFSQLEDSDRSSNSPRLEGEIATEIEELKREQEGMAPNMKAIEQYDEVTSRLHSIEGEFDSTRNNAKSITQQFHAVQATRKERFLTAFNVIAHAIDDVYKDLTQVEGVPLGGTAYLSLEDPSEPFLHGIKYNAMPPAKRFRDMDQLSGGERTVAALALLFAIHKFRPSPFFVMDEIDAALDNVNVTRVAEYIRERAAPGGNLQFVVISLKDNFYDKAHGLVGIFRDRALECSRTVTLDLEKSGGPPPVSAA